jgi:hypothetical protein
MPRSLSAAVLAQLTAAAIYPVVFVRIQFANEILYMFGGIGTITPLGPPADPASTFPYGQTWTGLGWLGKISVIPQTTKIQAQNIILSLSGIPTQLVLDTANQVRMYGTATIWLGFFDANGNLILDPTQVFFGALDVPTITDDAVTCSIAITAENPLISLNLAPNRQFDDMDQQIYVPGDLGMSFIAALQNLQLYWPMPLASGSPYPVKMTVVPASADIGVGGGTIITTTIFYSDGSTYAKPGGGAGPAVIVELASSNSQIATVDVTAGYLATGRAAGACSIIARVPQFGTGPGLVPISQLRGACNLIVH